LPLALDLPELRRRLASGSAPAFSVYGDDGARREAAAVTPASVLVPIVTHPGGLTVVFTQRTVHLRSHSGQISFPGGRAEPEDPTAEFTALREAQEEIGLAAERVEILARLPDYFTRTGYRVTPVIGLVEPPLEPVPDPREVADVFEVPLDFLLDPANHRRETRHLPGGTAAFYVLQYGERRIWGATAGILVTFYRLLAGTAAAAAPGG